METQKYRQTNKRKKNPERHEMRRYTQKNPPEKEEPIRKTDFVYLSLMLLLPLEGVTSSFCRRTQRSSDKIQTYF